MRRYMKCLQGWRNVWIFHKFGFIWNSCQRQLFPQYLANTITFVIQYKPDFPCIIGPAMTTALAGQVIQDDVVYHYEFASRMALE